MWTTIRNMIRQAYVSLVSNDTSPYPTMQATANSKPSKVTRLSVYGICSNPPSGAHVLLFSAQGQEAVKFGVPNDFINRLKNMTEGECALYNTLTRSMVLLRSDGGIDVVASASIDITAPEVNIISAKTTFNGDVVIDGDLEVDGIDFGTHVHPGITIGVNETGVPQ